MYACIKPPEACKVARNYGKFQDSVVSATSAPKLKVQVQRMSGVGINNKTTISVDAEPKKSRTTFLPS